ncbi:hypothetical protein V8G54_034124 [Vigna mungo]|uniref:Uncharacterized protein n=1 Tax=Vigna mungo TaxID=3915 RepID=A0AAQ3RI79_VIGMU
MVRDRTDGEEEIDACSGEHIDDLLEEENLDLEISSPHNSGFKVVFEDNPGVVNDLTFNGWHVNSNEIESKSNGWSAWVSQTKKSNDGCEVTIKCAARRVACLLALIESLH